jgi:hypothetical protein
MDKVPATFGDGVKAGYAFGIGTALATATVFILGGLLLGLISGGSGTVTAPMARAAGQKGESCSVSYSG